MDHMIAVASQKAHREIALFIMEGGWEVAAQPESVRNDKGVDGIRMVQAYIGLFEVCSQSGIERVESDGPGLPRRGLVEGLEEVPPVPAGGFGGEVNGIEVAVDDPLGNLAYEGLGARAVVVHGKAPSDLAPLAIHQTDGVGSAVDVYAHQQGIGHTQVLLRKGVSRLPMEGHPWSPMRAA